MYLNTLHRQTEIRNDLSYGKYNMRGKETIPENRPQ